MQCGIRIDFRTVRFRLAKPASFNYNLQAKKAGLAMQFTYRAEIYSYSSPPFLDKKGSDLSAIGHSVIDMMNYSVPRKSFLLVSIAFIVRLIENTNHSSRQCRQIFWVRRCRFWLSIHSTQCNGPRGGNRCLDVFPSLHYRRILVVTRSPFAGCLMSRHHKFLKQRLEVGGWEAEDG